MRRRAARSPRSHAADGAEVEVGAVLGAISSGAGAVAPLQQAGRRSPTRASTPPPRADGPVARPATPPADRAAALEAFPSAAKRLTEAGLGASSIGAGSGKDGRITKGDVMDFLAKPAPAAAPAPAPRVARVWTSHATSA